MVSLVSLYGPKFYKNVIKMKDDNITTIHTNRLLMIPSLLKVVSYSLSIILYSYLAFQPPTPLAWRCINKLIDFLPARFVLNRNRKRMCDQRIQQVGLLTVDHKSFWQHSFIKYIFFINSRFPTISFALKIKIRYT